MLLTYGTYIGVQDICVFQGVVWENGRAVVDLLQSQVNSRNGTSTHIISCLGGDVREVEWDPTVIALAMHLLQGGHQHGKNKHLHGRHEAHLKQCHALLQSLHAHTQKLTAHLGTVLRLK